MNTSHPPLLCSLSLDSRICKKVVTCVFCVDAKTKKTVLHACIHAYYKDRNEHIESYLFLVRFKSMVTHGILKL